MGAMSNKVKVNIQPGYALEIAGTWNDRLQAGGELQFNSRTLFCHAERPPSDQARYDKAGLAMAWIRSKVNDAEVTCSFKPDFKLHVSLSVEPLTKITIGNVEPDASFSWIPSGLLRLRNDLDPQNASEEVARFRSSQRA